MARRTRREDERPARKKNQLITRPHTTIATPGRFAVY